MPLNMSAVGQKSGPIEVSWTSRDSLLYALGVGAGQSDALAELNFTTENSAGVTQQVLPTYAVVIIQNARAPMDIGPIDRTKLVHGEQGFTLHAPLPVAGRVQVTGEVTGIFDKGSGALVTTRSQAVDADSGQLLISATSSAFIRGEGGFGGERNAGAASEPMPERAPDHRIVVPTRADQALLYRLSGDRNPLHSDPTFSSRGGFERPILHGMCTYGITGRILLQACAGGDPARVRSMSARFTRPVLPGETLTVLVWNANNDGPPTIRFRTLGPSGQPVIDHGVLTLN